MRPASIYYFADYRTTRLRYTVDGVRKLSNRFGRESPPNGMVAEDGKSAVVSRNDRARRIQISA